MTSRLYERQMSQRLGPQGITHRQAQVLAWLALEGELSQIDLAERMSIEPPTLVRVLDRMERDGLIVREACTADRRKKYIRPLPKSRAVWKKITACSEEVRALAATGLSEAQRSTLKEILNVVITNLADEECLAKMRMSPDVSQSPPRTSSRGQGRPSRKKT